jgi:hypothetical protein
MQEVRAVHSGLGEVRSAAAAELVLEPWDQNRILTPTQTAKPSSPKL